MQNVLIINVLVKTDNTKFVSPLIKLVPDKRK